VLALALIVIPVDPHDRKYVDAGPPVCAKRLRFGHAQMESHALVTLRAARAGVITGVLLAVCTGETAPLLLRLITNSEFRFIWAYVSRPGSIFKFAMSPENWQHWLGVFLTTLAVLGRTFSAVLTRQK
jgi:phosphate transport system permease protein